MGQFLSVCRRTRPRLNARDAVELSPFEKWRLYGIFPFKFFLHVALVILVTAQAYMVNEHYAAYSRAVGRNFVNIFFPPDRVTTVVADYKYELFTISDTIGDAHRLLDSYFKLPETSVDAVTVGTPQGQAPHCHGDVSCGIPLPVITLTFHEAPSQSYVMHNVSSPWPLQVGGIIDTAVQAGNLDLVRSFFDSVIDVTMTYVIKSQGWGGGIDRNKEVCLLWGLMFRYDVRYGGYFRVRMQYKANRRCSPLRVLDQYIVLCACVAVLALIYQVLLIKGVCRQVGIIAELRSKTRPVAYDPITRTTPKMDLSQHLQLFSPAAPALVTATPPRMRGTEKQPLLKQRHSYMTQPLGGPVSMVEGEEGEGGDSANGLRGALLVPSEWDKLSWADKMAVFNLWNVVSTLGNLLAMVYTSGGISMQTDIITTSALRIALGLSCLMYWFSLVQYLEFNPRYYVMILTLKTAVPRIGAFLVGIMPVFIGYSLLGLILFGDQNDLFGSMLSTSSTLFCVVNGDSLMTVLTSVANVPVLGELYICVYMMLFMYVCLMTCIAIVEEAFFAAADQAYNLFTGRHGLECIHGSVDDPLVPPDATAGVPASPSDPGPMEEGGRASRGSSVSHLSLEGLAAPSANVSPSHSSPPAITPQSSLGGASVSSGASTAQLTRRPSGRHLPPKLRQLLNSISTTDAPDTSRGAGTSAGARPVPQRMPSNPNLAVSPLSPVLVGPLAQAAYRYPSEGFLDAGRDSLSTPTPPTHATGEQFAGFYDARTVDRALAELQATLLTRLGSGGGEGAEEGGASVHARAEEERRDLLRAIAATKAKVLGGCITVTRSPPPPPQQPPGGSGGSQPGGQMPPPSEGISQGSKGPSGR